MMRRTEGLLLPAFVGAVLVAGGLASGAAEDNEPLVGIGAALRTADGHVLVAKILPDTPAAASALKPDDRILAIAEAGQEPIDVTGMAISKVVGMIRGRKGTVVRLTVIPDGKTEADAHVISLTRGEIATVFGDGRLLPVGEKAPDFEFTRLSDGEQRKFSGLGAKVVVVEFWATWCKPCMDQVDGLRDLKRRHPEWNGVVELLAVSVDDKKEDAEAGYKVHKWSEIAVAWAGPGPMKAYHIDRLPTVYVVDARGRIAAANSESKIEDIVERLLAGTDK